MPRNVDPAPALAVIRGALGNAFPLSGQGHVLALGNAQSPERARVPRQGISRLGGLMESMEGIGA